MTDYAAENLIGDFVTEGNVETFLVDPSSVGITKGNFVYLTSTTPATNSMGYVDNCPTGTKPIGVAMTSQVAYSRIDVILHGTTKMLVGVGGITVGAKAGPHLQVVAYGSVAANTSTVITDATYGIGRALYGGNSGDSVLVVIGMP